MVGLLSAERIRAGLDRTNKRNEPREGTKLRELWDLFLAHKGEAVEVTFSNRGSALNRRKLDDLTDYYGFDVKRLGPGRWMLVGRWIGHDYVSYVNKPLEIRPALGV